MEDTDLKQYRSAVENYAKNGVDYLFHNKGSEHALIILSNLFQNAQGTVRIAANRLFNDEVVNTPEYINSMRCFLDRKDSQLYILISHRPTAEEIKRVNRENTLYWMLYNHPAYCQGRIHIKEGEGKSFKNQDGNRVNFCTGDDRMFRLEDNIEERKAIANFRDEAFTQQLIKAFDSVYPTIQKSVDLHDFYSEC